MYNLKIILGMLKQPGRKKKKKKKEGGALFNLNIFY